MKAEIDTVTLAEISANLKPDTVQRLKEAIEAMNEMVNFIEHSGRMKTTKDYYGDYLPLIMTKQDFVLYRIAGAGQGACSAAHINLGI